MTNKVSAHSTLQGTITINGNYIIELETPPPSKLPWIEHVNRNEIRPNQPTIFRLDEQRITEIFKETGISYSWEIEKVGKFTTPVVTVSFPATGAYVVDLKILKGEEILTEEEIMVQVGTLPRAAKIILANESSEAKIVNSILIISRSETYTFKVDYPNIDKYTYSWDLGDRDVVEGVEVSKRFETTLLPAYVVLRTTEIDTSTYRDDYIRVESKLDFENGVPKPPFNPGAAMEQEQPRGITISPIGLALGIMTTSLAITVIAYVFVRYRTTKTKGHGKSK